MQCCWQKKWVLLIKLLISGLFFTEETPPQVLAFKSIWLICEMIMSLQFVKLKNLKFPNKYTIQKALITINGAESSLVDSDYFDHVLTINDFM